MDPGRIHAYLQAACAGLGFDIGEVWFSSTNNGTETVSSLGGQRISSAIGVQNGALERGRNIRFLQLYTSKSFNCRRNDLLQPDTDDSESSQTGGSNTTQSIQKHVLSPMLVNAIAKNAQVVWANCQKQEGLLGRSDMRLQTAVGMPVAMDSAGNMCIVVMFSPRNLTSSQDAIDFIKLISQSAASTKIPCLLPVVDSNQQRLEYSPKKFSDWEMNEIHAENNLYMDALVSRGGGLNNNSYRLSKSGNHDDNHFFTSTEMGNESDDALNDLAFLRKDQYGIPILPEFAELNTDGDNRRRENDTASSVSDDLGAANEFDNATYGLWSTIMNSPKINNIQASSNDIDISTFTLSQTEFPNQAVDFIHPERKERLEEFVSAFLGLSVFDLADVWVPITADDNGATSLYNVFAVSSSETTSSNAISYFKHLSRNTVIKGWSGAVGRAQCSGNAVWSTNQDIIIDEGRRDAFVAANIRTALAIPIYSNDSFPTCILACYSMVRSDSETFVLKFLQQALRSLWAGLDNVEPHESIGKKLWRGVAPADLGEMAADTEMQQAFYKRKRPHDMITNAAASRQVRTEDGSPISRRRSSSLAFQLSALPGDQIQQSFQQFQQPTQNNDPYNSPMSAYQGFVDQSTMNASQQTSKQPYVPTLQQKPQLQPNISLDQPVNGMQRPMPTHNSTGYEEDRTMAKNLIDTINALVQNGAQSQNGNLTIGSNQVNSNFLPESALSTGILICAPATLPTDDASAQLPLSGVSSTMNTALCRIEGCDTAAISRRPYCSRHSGNRICEYKQGCTKCAQGATRFCIAHGGGRRCTFPGCDKGARDKFFCAAHGGGKRCRVDGCAKSAVGGSTLCTSHGGGRRCSVDGCEKSAQSSTRFCVKHGGGKSCAHTGCNKVARGRTNFCAGHGGGVRCKLEGCSRIAIGKMQLCRTHGGGSSRAKKKAAQTTTMPQNMTAYPFLQQPPSQMHMQHSPPF